MYDRKITTALAKALPAALLAQHGYTLITPTDRPLKRYLTARGPGGEKIAVATKGLAHVPGRTTVTGLSRAATARFDEVMAAHPDFTPYVAFTASFNNTYSEVETLIIPVSELRRVAVVGGRFTTTASGDRLMWDCAKTSQPLTGQMSSLVKFTKA